MVKRRKPIRHTVSGHKRSGKQVRSYTRGVGSRTQKSKKVVGKVGIDWSKAKGINMLGDKWDIANDSYRAIGWRPSDRELSLSDKGDIIDSVQYKMEKKGYRPKRMTERQIRAYTEIEEDEDVLPFDYWVWRKGRKAIVVIHQW